MQLGGIDGGNVGVGDHPRNHERAFDPATFLALDVVDGRNVLLRELAFLEKELDDQVPSGLVH
jgi:hypothetical protein